MILVTGAAGKTGWAVIRALVTRKVPVRALVHRPEHVQKLKALGAREVVVGDMRLPATMHRASTAIKAVYHICPNVSPDEAVIGQAAIDAARGAGVQHFVYHSVLHPQVEAMPHHWLKLRVEEQLFESGLPYTILQPAAYMQNVLSQWDRLMEEGIYAVPYATGTRLGMVDLEDVAEVAAISLTDSEHIGATYELAGAEVLTQNQIARTLAHRLGTPVRAHEMSSASWERQARSAGLGEYQVDALTKMFQYYERYGFWGNPRVLGWLLGRPPASFAEFVERVASERLGRN